MRSCFVFSCFVVVVSGCDCSEPLHTGPVREELGDPEERAPEVGALRGVLCNAHVGDVVRDAQIIVTRGDDVLGETRTDDDGAFRLDDLPLGPAVLQATAPTFRKTEVVDVVAAEVVDVDVGGACALPAPGSFGGVRGRVCSPDGGTWLVDASASITVSDDEAFADTTDVDGRYELLDVPAGPQTLVIEKGSFRAEREVVIPADEVLELADDECALETEHLSIAVVRGSQFDHVENVLSSIGIDIETLDIFDSDWADQLLGPDERVRDYDILFLNCRSNEVTFAASAVMQERLRAFIADGGSVHASDQAYDLIEIAFPDKLDFLGDDGVRGSADRGAIADVEATVVDDAIAAAFGRENATLHYALETWSTMTSAAADVDVYLTADSPLMDGTVLADVPQIVGFGHGEGRVVYSSFHQEPGSHPDQVAILRLLMFEL